MIESFKKYFEKEFPAELVNKLLHHYSRIKENYLLERHEPSELNGGKFCEVVYRLIEYKLRDDYSPLDKHIPNLIGKLRDIENEPKDKLNKTLRIHFPRVLVSIYNIRNKRGVGHLDGKVSPNKMDSTIICSSSDWIIGELLRLYHTGDADTAQSLIDALVEINYYLVHEEEGIKRVLHPDLGYKSSILLLLSNEYPDWVDVEALSKWIEPSSEYYFKTTILERLHNDRSIEFDQENMKCKILPTGLKFVEKNYEDWLKELKQQHKLI